MIQLLRLRVPSLVVGLLAAAALIVGLFLRVNATIWFRAYLFGYVFCLALALGCLCLLMLHNLTGGEWGDAIRPAAHAGALTLPAFAILFIPICFGLPTLFPWANAAEVASDELLSHRTPYLNMPFFIARAALYFVIWIALAMFTRPGRLASRGLSAAGLILYLWTMTHAGIDWIMSRDVAFYSTAFGFVVTVGQTLAALAFCVILVPWARGQPSAPPQRRMPGALVLNDLGSLLITLVILWTYVSFMEFLVVWMGNTHEDNTWFLQRGLRGNMNVPGDIAWHWIAAFLIAFHFFVPFYLLLFRGLKKERKTLTGVAWMLFIAHIVEVYWLVAPSHHDASAVFNPHWLDLAALLGIGGLWFCLFLFFLSRHPNNLAATEMLEGGEPAHG